MRLTTVNSADIIGLLTDCYQSFLCHPSGLKKARKIEAFTQLGDAKRDCPSPRLQVVAAVAVALNKPVGGPLAGGCTCQGAHLQFHQALGGESNHVSHLAEYPRRGHFR